MNIAEKQLSWWKNWLALGFAFGSTELIFNAFFGRFPLFAVKSCRPIVAIPVGSFFEVLVWVVLALAIGGLTEVVRRIFRGGYSWHLGARVGAVLGLEAYLVRSLMAVGFRDGLFRNMPTPWGEDSTILTVIALVALLVAIAVGRVRRSADFKDFIRDDRNLVLLVFAFAAGYALIYNRWMSTTDWPLPSAKPLIAAVLIAMVVVGIAATRRKWMALWLSLRFGVMALIATVLLTVWYAYPSSDKRPGIIVLLWDTARAGRMSLYEYNESTTPGLENLAAEALVFDAAYSPSNYTYPSHVTFFTGKSYREHNYHSGYGADMPRYREEYVLTERLGELGYYSALFTENSWVYAADKGFDEVRFLPMLATYPGWGSNSCEIGEFPPLRKYVSPFLGRILVDSIQYWFDGYYTYTLEQIQFRLVQELYLRSRRTGPFFLFWNWMTVHDRYHPYTEWPVGEEVDNYDLVREYDLSLRNADRRFMELYRRLRECGKLDNTILIVTSDHGEFLGESRLWGHNKALFEPVLRVPLLIRSASLQPGRIFNAVSLTHFRRLIESLAGNPERIDSKQIENIMIGPGKVIAEHGYLPEEWSKEYKWCYTVIEGNRQYVYDPLIPTYHSSFSMEKEDYLFEDLFNFGSGDEQTEAGQKALPLRQYYLDYLNQLKGGGQRLAAPGAKDSYTRKLRALGYL